MRTEDTDRREEEVGEMRRKEEKGREGKWKENREEENNINRKG